MKRRIVLTGVTAVYLVTGAAACIQFGKMDAAFAVSGETTNIELSAPAYSGFLSASEAGDNEEAAETETADDAALPKSEEEGGFSDPQDVSYSFTAVHGEGRLFVRLEPSMNGEIIGFLAPGDEGEVLELGSDWALILSGDLTGYVSVRYLELQEKEGGR